MLQFAIIAIPGHYQKLVNKINISCKIVKIKFGFETWHEWSICCLQKSALAQNDPCGEKLSQFACWMLVNSRVTCAEPTESSINNLTIVAINFIHLSMSCSGRGDFHWNSICLPSIGKDFWPFHYCSKLCYIFSDFLVITCLLPENVSRKNLTQLLCNPSPCYSLTWSLEVE